MGKYKVAVFCLTPLVCVGAAILIANNYEQGSLDVILWAIAAGLVIGAVSCGAIALITRREVKKYE